MREKSEYEQAKQQKKAYVKEAVLPAVITRPQSVMSSMLEGGISFSKVDI